MKLSRYMDFINESKENIDSICERYGIRNYTINEDGSIDVDGDIDLNNEKLTKLPLKFRNVTGNFYCYQNKLTSLEGCPQSVGDFYCGFNKLTSLEGCPQIVEGNFNCSYNSLTSLEGCPQIIGGDFSCYYNKITDFNGLPEYFEGHFNFYVNPVQEILNLFNNHPKSIDWINEHDVIQGNKVILRRLEEVYHELKMDVPEKLIFKNYEII